MLGDIDGIAIYSSHEPSERATLFTLRALSLHNFACIITSLVNLFELKGSSVHILHTAEAPRHVLRWKGALLFDFNHFDREREAFYTLLHTVLT